jgi:hypothetical protein
VSLGKAYKRGGREEPHGEPGAFGYRDHDATDLVLDAARRMVICPRRLHDTLKPHLFRRGFFWHPLLAGCELSTPAVYRLREFVDAGGFADLMRRSAAHPSWSRRSRSAAALAWPRTDWSDSNRDPYARYVTGIS